MIDKALERRLGKHWPDLPRAAELAERFTVATRLEVGFWEMAITPLQKFHGRHL